jgi:Uma2 family endonuclease
MSPPYLLRKYEATVEDFEHLADEDLRCEYFEGVLVVHSPASFTHENLSMFLGSLLRTFAEERRLGWVLGGNAVMQLKDRRFCPDISFIQSAHAGWLRTGQVAGPVDLAVEILSHSTRDYDLREKRAAYREGNVPEIWLIDSERQEFHVDSLEPESTNKGMAYHTELLKRGRWSSYALKGFWVDVEWLWSDPLPNVLDCFRAVTGT